MKRSSSLRREPSTGRASGFERDPFIDLVLKGLVQPLDNKLLLVVEPFFGHLGQLQYVAKAVKASVLQSGECHAHRVERREASVDQNMLELGQIEILILIQAISIAPAEMEAAESTGQCLIITHLEPGVRLCRDRPEIRRSRAQKIVDVASTKSNEYTFGHQAVERGVGG